MARRGAIDRLEEPVRATVDKLIHEGHTTVAIGEHLAGLGTFQIQGLLPANFAVRTAVEEELKDLIRREAVPDTNVPLLISHIREAISIAAGEFDHRLLDPTADVAHGVGEIATFGGVVWS
jgi:hypothetical protein